MGVGFAEGYRWDSEQQARLAALFYRHIDPNDLTGRDPAAIHGAVHHLVDSAASRASGLAIVTATNPTVEADGWACGRTVVTVVTDDMPFLVDSVTGELSAWGWGSSGRAPDRGVTRADRAARPRRAPARRCSTSSPAARGPGRRVARVVDAHRDRPAGRSDADVAAIEASLQRVLRDVRESVRGLAPDGQRALELAAALEAAPPAGVTAEDAETAACCAGWPTTTSPSSATASTTWSTRTGTTSAGRRGRAAAWASCAPTAPVDVVRQAAARVRQTRARAAPARAHQGQPPLHRAPPGLPRLRRGEEVRRRRARSWANDRFLGLYAAAAYTQSVLDIPVLGARSSGCHGRLGFTRGSPQRQGPPAVPRDLSRATSCSQIDTDELVDDLQRRAEPAGAPPDPLFMRRDPYEPVRLGAGLPARATATPPVRRRMEAILATALRRRQRRLHRAGVRVGAGPAALRRAHAGRASRAAGRHRGPRARASPRRRARWHDELADALRRASSARSRARRCSSATPTPSPRRYKEDVPRRAAVGRRAPRSSASTDAAPMALAVRAARRRRHARRFKLYPAGRQMSLSEVLPVLHHLGVEVVDERPYAAACAPTAARPGSTTSGCASTPPAPRRGRLKARFEEAFAAAWDGRCERDGFNGLVAAGGPGLATRSRVRAYWRYLRQTGSRSASSTSSARCWPTPRSPALVELFDARFDPDRAARTAPAQAGSLARRSRRARRGRQPRRRPHPALAAGPDQRHAAHQLLPGRGRRPPEGVRRLKFDPQRIPDLPAPRPQYEIWVYSPAGRGRAPALRHGRPRRPALVRPARGLPHRGARAW